MIYAIEATEEGYSFTCFPGKTLKDIKGTGINLSEGGGHGLLEELYGNTERTFNKGLAQVRAQSKKKKEKKS